MNLKQLNCNISVKISNNIPYESLFKSQSNLCEIPKNYNKNKQSIVKKEAEEEENSISDIEEKLDYILGKTNK